MGGTRRTVAAIALAVVAVAGPAACADDGGGGSEDAFCAQVARVPSLAAALSNFTDRDPAALRARLDDARAAYDALVDAAPDDVRADTRTVVDLIDEVIDAVDAHPDDNEAAAAELRAAVADHPDAGDAAGRVSAYAKATCDIDLDPTAPGVDETTTTAAPEGAGG